MKFKTESANLSLVNRTTVNRRAFLRGVGTVAIGLPFLEGLPERSAWAQSSPPVFSLYIVATCGVVGKKFFPDATGALTTASLAAMTDKATSVLSLPLDEASAKVRDGAPDDGDTRDAELDVWAGHIPLTVRSLPPVAAPDLRAGIPVPAYAKRYRRPGLTD